MIRTFGHSGLDFYSVLPQSEQAIRTLTVHFLPIEGVIAAGKSTLLDKVKKEPDMVEKLVKLLGVQDLTNLECDNYTHIIAIKEPIEKWTSVGKNRTNLLMKMYQDMNSFGALCQTHIIQSRLNNILDELTNVVVNADGVKDLRVLVLTERSTLTDSQVFAKSMHTNRKMTEEEWTVYKTSFNNAHHAWFFQLQAAAQNVGIFAIRTLTLASIFLTIDTKQSCSRIKSRGRPFEQDIEQCYIEQLAEQHKKLFFNNKIDKSIGIIDHPVICVNTDILAQALTKYSDGLLILKTVSKEKVLRNETFLRTSQPQSFKDRKGWRTASMEIVVDVDSIMYGARDQLFWAEL